MDGSRRTVGTTNARALRMTEQSMVERVGWAICGAEDGGYCECQQRGRGLCDDVRDITRAAIEAMLEPTEAMIEVAFNGADFRSASREEVRDGYKTMISEALK